MVGRVRSGCPVRAIGSPGGPGPVHPGQLAQPLGCNVATAKRLLDAGVLPGIESRGYVALACGGPGSLSQAGFGPTSVAPGPGSLSQVSGILRVGYWAVTSCSLSSCDVGQVNLVTGAVTGRGLSRGSRSAASLEGLHAQYPPGCPGTRRRQRTRSSSPFRRRPRPRPPSGVPGPARCVGGDRGRSCGAVRVLRRDRRPARRGTDGAADGACDRCGGPGGVCADVRLTVAARGHRERRCACAGGARHGARRGLVDECAERAGCADG